MVLVQINTNIDSKCQTPWPHPGTLHSHESVFYHPQLTVTEPIQGQSRITDSNFPAQPEHAPRIRISRRESASSDAHPHPRTRSGKARCALLALMERGWESWNHDGCWPATAPAAHSRARPAWRVWCLQARDYWKALACFKHLDLTGRHSNHGLVG